jgi:hypothetical protein
MVAILHEYSPECQYLMASYVEMDKGVVLSVNNACYDITSRDHKVPVECCKVTVKE